MKRTNVIDMRSLTIVAPAAFDENFAYVGNALVGNALSKRGKNGLPMGLLDGRLVGERRQNPFSVSLSLTVYSTLQSVTSVYL